MTTGLEIVSGKQKGSEFFFHILDLSHQGTATTILNSSVIPTDPSSLQIRAAKISIN